MENRNEITRGHIFFFIFGLIAIVMMSFYFINYEYGTICKVKSKFNSDSYCYKSPTSWSNVSDYNSFEWKEGSHEQDVLDELERQERTRLHQEEQRRLQKCYDDGYFINQSFVVQDYGLNCGKIAYLNNHLMDDFDKKDSGSISGRYSGFFSSGHISGQSYQYVNERVLATGQLIENINYHVDCEGNKHNEQIDYITEEEFVMYYVEECIK